MVDPTSLKLAQLWTQMMDAKASKFQGRFVNSDGSFDPFWFIGRSGEERFVNPDGSFDPFWFIGRSGFKKGFSS